jgi:dipeptidyl aminopeptidase/acylaminoacyl peptidase
MNEMSFAHNMYREDSGVKMSRRITRDDLWSLRTMGKIALAPDGCYVAFEMHSNDKEHNDTCCALFLLSLDENGHAIGEPRQLTNGIKHDTFPVWAPDSKQLLFISDREDEKNQLWLINTTGGEARKLTSMLHGVSEATWSPDGKWIAFTAPASPYDDLDVLLGRKVLDEQAQRKYAEDERYSLRSVSSIWYKSDGRGLFVKYSQLFVMPAPLSVNAVLDTGSIRRLTSTAIDHTQPSWTPDSQELGFLCNRNNNRDRSFVQDLWIIHRETAEARCLTEGDLEIESYSWSPDGLSAILVAAKDQIEYGCSLLRLYLVTRNGNVGDRTLALSPDLAYDTSLTAGGGFGLPGPYHVQWSADGQQIYFVQTERGCAYVYCQDIVWRSLTQLTTLPSLTSYVALLPQRQALLLAQENAHHPFELYLLPIENAEVGALKCLTHIYDSWLEECTWAKTEMIHYHGADGEEIDGWVIHPVGAREGLRYPLMVVVHGGPHWAFDIGMNTRLQYIAAQGYAVFYCNPHGSTGYGEAFMRSVLGDWGGRDFQDIMLGIDACIERGIADPERLTITGYSYGGYMTMFAIGQTGRFKAAAPMAGISNLASFVGTSDISFWLVAESLGHPWDPERVEYYRARSPLTFAPHVTTPTILIHPENDLRCPIEQSEQFYMALKMIENAPVELIRVPAASHSSNSAKPGQMMLYWEKVLHWFNRFITFKEDEYSAIET